MHRAARTRRPLHCRIAQGWRASALGRTGGWATAGCWARGREGPTTAAETRGHSAGSQVVWGGGAQDIGHSGVTSSTGTQAHQPTRQHANPRAREEGLCCRRRRTMCLNVIRSSSGMAARSGCRLEVRAFSAWAEAHTATHAEQGQGGLAHSGGTDSQQQTQCTPHAAKVSKAPRAQVATLKTKAVPSRVACGAQDGPDTGAPPAG
jgi:hypothetical protein